MGDPAMLQTPLDGARAQADHTTTAGPEKLSCTSEQRGYATKGQDVSHGHRRPSPPFWKRVGRTRKGARMAAIALTKLEGARGKETEAKCLGYK